MSLIWFLKEFDKLSSTFVTVNICSDHLNIFYFNKNNLNLLKEYLDIYLLQCRLDKIRAVNNFAIVFLDAFKKITRK